MKREPKLLVMVRRLEVYKCNRCIKVFADPSTLMKHMSYHDEWFLSHVVSAYVRLERIKVFKCDDCTKSFYSKRDFMFHKVEHIQNNVRYERKLNKLGKSDILKPFKCPECDCEFVAKSSLDEHSAIHLPFPHICDCGIGYYKYNDLILHKNLVHSIVSDPKPKTITDSPQKRKLSPAPKSSTNRRPTLKAVLVKKAKPDRKKNKMKLKPQTVIMHPNIDIIKTPDNRYQCPDCPKTFPNRCVVYIHYRTHNGDRPYFCHLCDKSFSQSGSLKAHIRRHTLHLTEKTYACSHCTKTFHTPENKARHELIHNPIKQYECRVCGKAFHDPSALVRHRRIHTQDKRYRCPYCPQAFTDVSGLYRHKLIHENKKDFACDICAKTFYTIYELKKHLRAYHNNDRIVCCDYCKNYYSSKCNLALHIQTMHTTSSTQVKCDKCNKMLASMKILNQHISAIHKNVKKFACKDCNRLFFSRAKLSRHVADGDFKCNTCSERFCRNFSLAYHYRTAHSDLRCDKKRSLNKSETCEVCKKTFLNKELKDKHFTVHIGERTRYECDDCGKVFLYKNSLARHIKQHTN